MTLPNKKKDQPSFNPPILPSYPTDFSDPGGTGANSTSQLPALALNVDQLVQRMQGLGDPIVIGLLQVLLDMKRPIDKNRGIFTVTTSAPVDGTDRPQDAYDQIRVYTSGSTYRLYWYDWNADAWHYVAPAAATATVYSGKVSSNAAGTPFPAGWSVSRVSAGVYTITHNLGTASYVVGGPLVIGSASVTIANETAHGTNTFTLTFYNQTAAITWAATDTDFFFSVMT